MGRRLLPGGNGQALQSGCVRLRGAVSFGKAVFIWLPAFLCHLSRTLVLFSTCNIATLPSLLVVLLAKLEFKVELVLFS